MKIFAPTYYKQFKCIADKCRHSCCVGWRIKLDDRTATLYNYAEGGYGDLLRKNIAEDNDGKYIPLTKNGRCPHLDSDGLCRIIKEYGEEYLSEICTHHPRFYNELGDRVEAGLGASCPEAARLILDTDSELMLCEVGETDAEEVPCNSVSDRLRATVFASIGSDKDHSEIESEIWQYIAGGIEIPTLASLCDVFSTLEYMSNTDKALFSALHEPKKINSVFAKRLLHYFVYRHLSISEDELDARARVGFALLSVRAVFAIAEAASLSLQDSLIKYSEEIEYSTDNTEALIFEISSILV